MKKLITLIFVFTALTLTASAQNYPFGLGVSAAGKAGVNTSFVPNGFKNAVAIYPGVDISALVYFPFDNEGNNRNGVIGEISYSHTPLRINDYQGNNGGNIAMPYIGASIKLMMSGFYIGAELAFTSEAECEDFIYNNGFAPLDEDMGVNLNLGYMHPIARFGEHGSLGTLNFFANVGYGLSGTQFQVNRNYHPATLSLGLNFMFNMEAEDDY